MVEERENYSREVEDFMCLDIIRLVILGYAYNSTEYLGLISDASQPYQGNDTETPDTLFLPFKPHRLETMMLTAMTPHTLQSLRGLLSSGMLCEYPALEGQDSLAFRAADQAHVLRHNSLRTRGLAGAQPVSLRAVERIDGHIVTGHPKSAVNQISMTRGRIKR